MKVMTESNFFFSFSGHEKSKYMLEYLQMFLFSYGLTNGLIEEEIQI